MLESAYFSGKMLAGDGNLDDQGVGDKAVYFDRAFYRFRDAPSNSDQYLGRVLL
jgi:hypothetical protein